MGKESSWINEGVKMKTELITTSFGHYDKLKDEISDFIKDKQVVDIKLTTDYAVSDGMQCGGAFALIMYEEKKHFQIKKFNEGDYLDYSDTVANMEDAVNAFCKEHEVVSISTNQDSDENYLITVVYKE